MQAGTSLAAPALVVVVSALPVSGGVVSATANSVTYLDTRGEKTARASPDVGAVTVSNDEAGVVTFDIGFLNRGFRPATDVLIVDLDTDRDRETGHPPAGADWALYSLQGRTSLMRWNGRTMRETRATSLTASMVGRSVVLSVRASDFGRPSAFRFDVLVMTFASGNVESDPVGADLAPDGGKRLWAYRVLVARPVLTASRLTVSPHPPRAGEPLMVRTTVTAIRGGSAGRPGVRARVVAVARVNGERIVGKVAPGSATGRIAAEFAVPRAARGKVLTGYVEVSLDGASVKRTFRAQVR